ncbi:hypothetical protein B0C18_000365 [Salmonella enterica]|nr:hypothetical protein [Salmonella enterica]
MSNFFEEKTAQFYPFAVQAFGVKLTSRYDKVCEYAEMLKFIHFIAANDLQHLFREIDYDSQSQCCYFNFNSSVNLSRCEIKRIIKIASTCLSQFEIDDCIHHGDGISRVKDKCYIQ